MLTNLKSSLLLSIVALGIASLGGGEAYAQIRVTQARIGCLDIQRTGNLTRIVARACNGKTRCSYKAPSPRQYRRMGVRARTRVFCTQAMEITYHCGDRKPKLILVPGDAWKRPPAELLCHEGSAARPHRARVTSPIFKPKLNSARGPLRGFVDLHTHPMAHLGFGQKLLHGAPDVGVLIGAHSISCNQRQAKRVRSRAEALGNCMPVHGPPTKTNSCGNHYRPMTIKLMEDAIGAKKDHKVPGYPDFKVWPAYNSVSHQQMWVDWIKRAWQGGLRVMVALAVNNRTLATTLRGNSPFNDKHVARLQILETKRLVARHSWMEIATTPAELARIVRQDKLAIILGVEIDDIGDFLLRKQPPTRAMIATEIEKLHKLGVRYIFPVHLINNHFGGSAFYNASFQIANRFHAGHWMDLICADKSEGIEFEFKKNAGWFGKRVAGWLNLKLDPLDRPRRTPCLGKKRGHRNAYGLNRDLGVHAIKTMMRLGMIIDVDHMSNYAVDQTLVLAESVPGIYPLVSGHSQLRHTGSKSKTHEGMRTLSQYQRITRGGGMAGIEWDNMTAQEWLATLRRARRPLGGKIALGTDINGMVVAPGPPADSPVRYKRRRHTYRFGNRTFDYNRDGVAHYGMVPDLLRHLELIGGDTEVQALYSGAEAYYQMWSKAERLKGRAAEARLPAARFHIAKRVGYHGNDYRSFRARDGSWRTCQEACAREARCRAFTWRAGLRKRCFLKTRAANRRSIRNATSGVKY